MMAPDDMESGDFVFVVTGAKIPELRTPFYTSEQPDPLAGHIMQIVAVDVPVLTADVFHDSGNWVRTIVDVRGRQFMRLSKKIVATLPNMNNIPELQ